MRVDEDELARIQRGLKRRLEELEFREQEARQTPTLTHGIILGIALTLSFAVIATAIFVGFFT